MKAKKSPLVFEGFVVQELQFSVISPTEGDLVVIEEPEITMDFEILTNDDIGQDRFLIPMQMQINTGKKQVPGYALEVTALGTFSIETSKKIPISHRTELQIYSSTNIMISSLRGYLRDLTGYGPFGAYVLPSIDMADLISQKKIASKPKPKKRRKKLK